MLSALIVGCVAAYYFGLRSGAYVAVAALLLSLIASLLPRYAFAIDLCIAGAVVVIWRLGVGRPVPPDSALAIRYVRRTIGRWIDRVWGK